MTSAVLPRAAAAAALALAALDAGQRQAAQPAACSSMAIAGAQWKRPNSGKHSAPWLSPRPPVLEASFLAPMRLEVFDHDLVRMPPGTQRAKGAGGLAQYEIETCLGRGAFGEVFRARHKATGELRAVKRSRRGAGGLAARAFDDEVQALSSIKHPGVVGLIEYFSEGEDDYLVEELCGGLCLLDYIAESKTEFDGVPYVPESTSADILRQCLAAVAGCHSQGLAHRDLKPENFVVAEDGSVKLVDFGLACPASPTSGQHRGFLLGSAPYMAPEMVSQDVHSVAVDVWSLGSVFFTLMTGEFLLPEDSDSACRCLLDETFVDRRLAKCKALSKLSISDEAMDLLRQMLRHDPSTRITAAGALLHPVLVLSRGASPRMADDLKSVATV